MFSKNNERVTSKVDTIIGKNFNYKGVMEATEGSLRIDGSFEGDLRIGGNLFVGETGVITGSVTANNVTIAGQVTGQIDAKGKLELTPTAKVLADIKMLYLAIEDGAFFQGQCEPQSKEEFKKPKKDLQTEDIVK